MTRPLLIIFLTIFVNLIGFGIIIPLLPFYAETFGASPLVIGLLFAVFSLVPAVAAPVLGDLSDRYGRRPVLIFSLLGTVVSFVMLALAHSVTMLFVARIVDGLSGGNISTARAYVADVTEPKDRARAYGLIGAAFGLGFILGPALSGVLAKVSYTAPIWAAAALTLVATAMAWLWLPETVHRAQAGTGMPFREPAGAAAASEARPRARHRFRVLVRVRDLPDDVRAVRRAAVRLRRVRRPATSSPRSACSARSCRAASSGRSSRGSATSRRSCSVWLLRRSDWSRRRSTHSVAMFALTLVPLALGIGFGHPTVSSLVSRAARGDEQGRVQGAASAVESLGRTVGPVWGNASLQRFGEGMPYLSAAAFLIVTLLLSVGYQVPEQDIEQVSRIA